MPYWKESLLVLKHHRSDEVLERLLARLPALEFRSALIALEYMTFCCRGDQALADKVQQKIAPGSDLGRYPYIGTVLAHLRGEK